MVRKYTGDVDEADVTLPVVQEALKRYDIGVQSWQDQWKLSKEDLDFRSGDQWTQEAKTARADRPQLTINRIPYFIRLVTNDARQNRPAITVSATDEDTSVETAKVVQGMIRHIEYDSNADFAYDTAADFAATMGFGYMRVTTEYENEKSFDQVIKIKRVANPFSVVADPSAKEPDGSDYQWAFIIDNITKEEHKRRWPRAKLSGLGDWKAVPGIVDPSWVSTDGCRVAEYFCIEWREATIYLDEDDEVWEEGQLTPVKVDGKMEYTHPNNKALVGQRKTQLPTVKWRVMNGVEVLEETEWLGKWIPIIPVYGDELNIQGKVTYEGIVRHAKDPQRMANYWASAETEAIALAPKAPWLGAEGQFEGHETDWAESNTKNTAYLEYKPMALNGQNLPPPSRNVQEPAIQAISAARAAALDDLKATTGTYDAALGMKGNETSGYAILQRKMQHNISNFHFPDNFSRGLRQLGRVVTDLIPKIYDTVRVIRIINPDGEHEVVTINQEKVNTQTGVKNFYDVRNGKYDIVISSGPSYATKRQEAVATMLQLITADPEIAKIVGDLLVTNMDWEGAQEIAARLRRMVPAQALEDQPIPPAVQQQIKQMQQMLMQLGQALNVTTEKLESKVMEVQSKERIALNKNLTDLIIVAEQIDADHSMTAFTEMMRHIQIQLANQGGGDQAGQSPEDAARPVSALLSQPLPGQPGSTQPNSPPSPNQPPINSSLPTPQG